jgi:hypothetical protein
MHRRSVSTQLLAPWRRTGESTSPRHARRRRTSKGLALLAAIVLPITISQLMPLSASASGPDTVQFTQTSGSSKAYFQYTPGDGSTVTTQNVTGGGGCSNPTLGASQTGKTKGSTAPILGWAASVYSNQTNYSGTATPAIVGAYNGRTGVCALSQNYSIDNVPQPSSGNSKWGVEELDFTPGTNSVDSGRSFDRATIHIQNNNSTSTTVHLVETSGGSPVAHQDCTIPGSAIAITDTKPDGVVCTGTDASLFGFDKIAIQAPNPGESVSVVQTSTFTLGGGQICTGDTISTASTDGSTSTDVVSASITLNGSTQYCKTYSNFAVSANQPGDYPNVMVFGGSSSQTLPGDDHFTTTIDWGDRPYCQPTECAPTEILLPDATQFTDQTFCPKADPPSTAAWCTTSQKFTYDDVNGTTMTHIVETWDGVGDPTTRRPGGP